MSLDFDKKDDFKDTKMGVMGTVRNGPLFKGEKMLITCTASNEFIMQYLQLQEYTTWDNVSDKIYDVLIRLWSKKIEENEINAIYHGIGVINGYVTITIGDLDENC